MLSSLAGAVTIRGEEVADKLGDSYWCDAVGAGQFAAVDGRVVGLQPSEQLGDDIWQTGYRLARLHRVYEYFAA